MSITAITFTVSSMGRQLFAAVATTSTFVVVLLQPLLYFHENWLDIRHCFVESNPFM